MNRIKKARSGYLNKNRQEILKSHEPEVIRDSIRHEEKHRNSFNLPEIILGGQDGLVNVLGVILGVAAATSSSKIIVVAGLAATFAESISMAAVAYTSKITEADYYRSELEREKWEIENYPEGEKEEIRALYESYGFKGESLDNIADTITSDKKIWLKVMMEQELKLEEVDRSQALPSGLLVGTSAFIGSAIPLMPFIFLSVGQAIWVSLIASAAVLFIVGYYKAKVTLGRQYLRQGAEIAVIGMTSAAVGYLVGVVFK